jgi:hypothetical protein
MIDYKASGKDVVPQGGPVSCKEMLTFLAVINRRENAAMITLLKQVTKDELKRTNPIRPGSMLAALADMTIQYLYWLKTIRLIVPTNDALAKSDFFKLDPEKIKGESFARELFAFGFQV